MSVRRLVVEVDLDGLNVSEFCREHGISRAFFYDLRKRFAREGEAALEPKSRAPHRVANRTECRVEDLIVELRKELGDLGLDAGPGTIHWHLSSRLPEGSEVPSESTIWRVLKRRGFVVPQPKKAPKHAYRRFSAQRANECWQIDDTGWELADDTSVKIINILDDCTRVLTRTKAVVSCTGEAVLEAFGEAGERWGLCAWVLADNARVHRHTLADALTALGISMGFSRPYHPQTCGKVERFHATLKKHLATLPRAETLDELQAQLDEFIEIYNHQRPHRSLGRRTPADTFATTPKSGPADRPLDTPTRLHHAVVSKNGVCYLTRYAISLGATHAGQHATIIITGLACHVFIDGRLVRQLTLNPNRRTQPLYTRPGRPSTVNDVPRDV